jgi:F-type H+-transporting ATPase subunit beta
MDIKPGGLCRFKVVWWMSNFSIENMPDMFEALEVVSRMTFHYLEVGKHMGDILSVVLLWTPPMGCEKILSLNGRALPLKSRRPRYLGRVFNVLGNVVDNKGDVKAEAYYPIHRAAPKFEEHPPVWKFLKLVLKVIDLIAPFTKGGKSGIFGGAGVGKTVIIMEYSARLHRASGQFCVCRCG